MAISPQPSLGLRGRAVLAHPWPSGACAAAGCQQGGSASSRAHLASQRPRSARPAAVLSSAAGIGGLLAAAAAVRRRRSMRTRCQGTAAADPPAEEESLSVAIESWLMEQDLPTPLKPVLGSKAWASFAAALFQMFVVAGLSALGTLLEQGRPAEFYAKSYPETSGIILTLGLDHVYSCPLFLVLLAWLAASLLACTATTQLPLAKKAQDLNLRSSSSMIRRGSFLMRINCPAAAAAAAAASVDAGPSASSRLLEVREELKKRGFMIRSDDQNSPNQLAASRGLIGKFAPMVVHLAMLLSLAGNTVGLIFGASSEVMIGDGGFADVGQVIERGRRSKGALYDLFSPNKGLMDNTNVKVEDFRIEYKDDGQIEQYYSKLVLENAQTKERLYSDEIYVNKPLRYGGATLYQADWGIDRLQMYLNGRGIVVPLKSLPDQDGNRAWGAFIPIELVKANDPEAVKKISNTQEGLVLVVSNMRNVQVYGSDKELAGVLRSPDAKVEKKMEGMPIQFGEEITVEGTSKLRLDKILGSTGLIVKSDPGVPLVYAGYALLMPATILSVLPFAQVWVSINKDDENQILISGKANRNQLSFEDEMQAAVLSITNRDSQNVAA